MISYRLVILSSGVPQSTVRNVLGIVISNLDNDHEFSFQSRSQQIHQSHSFNPTMPKSSHTAFSENAKSDKPILIEMIKQSDENYPRNRYSGEALGTVKKYYVDGKQRLIPVPTSDPLGSKVTQIA